MKFSMPKLDMKNIYTTFKPFYFLAKALGLFPLSYDGPVAKGKLKVMWFDVCITIFAFSLLLSFALLKLNLREAVLIDSTILVKSWEISLEFGLGTTIIQFCYQFVKRNEAKKFLKQLNNFDQQVKSSQWKL